MMKHLLLTAALFAFATSPAMAFDHDYTSWEKVLDTHVDKGVVDYSAIKKAGALNPVLTELQAVADHEGWTQDQKLAFWINAYNAYTIALIVNNMPVESIRDIGWPFSPWKKEFIPMMGNTVSLDFIEHETIRKDFKEPRIHFALVCASKGCPPLADTAYVASKLDAQLEANAVAFLNDGSKNRVDAEGLYLSSIFSWYGGDFDGGGGVRVFVKARLDGVAEQPISYLDYDWTLNGH